MAFRAQQLLRGVAVLLELGVSRNAVSALQQAVAHGMPVVAGQPGLGAVAALTPLLQRGFHLPAAAAAAAAAGPDGGGASGAPALSPLQEAPPPAAARRLLGLEEGLAGVGRRAAARPPRARAVLRGAAISPRKLNMFAKVVRGLRLDDALIQCEVSCKKSAGIVRNVLRSARANAVNNLGLDAERLVVEEAWVGPGQHLKRTSVHGRGRSGKRLRYRAHLTVVLAEKEGVRQRTRVLPTMAERWGKKAGLLEKAGL